MKRLMARWCLVWLRVRPELLECVGSVAVAPGAAVSAIGSRGPASKAILDSGAADHILEFIAGARCCFNFAFLLIKECLHHCARLEICCVLFRLLDGRDCSSVGCELDTEPAQFVVRVLSEDAMRILNLARDWLGTYLRKCTNTEATLFA